MYRAIVTSISPNAQRSVYQLRKELIKQFENSPLCQSVIIQRDPVLLDKSVELVSNAKSKVSDSWQQVNKDLLKTFLISPEGLRDTLELEGVDNVAVVGSIFKTKDYKKILLPGTPKHKPSQHVSIFGVSYLIEEDDRSLDHIPAGNAEKFYKHIYPIASQFLPARFREITPKHLALAIRLNFETCEFSPTEDGIEELDYVDCMKIIGLDERI